jgi:hypothetical protein
MEGKWGEGGWTGGWDGESEKRRAPSIVGRMEGKPPPAMAAGRRWSSQSCIVRCSSIKMELFEASDMTCPLTSQL